MTTSLHDVAAGPTDAGREFWRDVLLAGGRTTVPRWTLDAAARVAGHETAVPGSLVAAVRALADDLRIPVSTLLLAAHARTLAALSGEQEVVTGCLTDPGASALPCRVTTEARSWRDLLADVHRVESALLAHRHMVDDLRLELGIVEAPFEVTFGLTDRGTGDRLPPADDLPEGVVLQVGFALRDTGAALAMRYRTDVIDSDCAARIAGYHLTALSLMTAGPDAAHSRQSLLSPGEYRYQLEGLAGPHRELPDRRAHELFEERVRQHPNAVAAVHRGRRWTYAELNARANHVGHALLARGLGREDVVAVVTERNLDWMAAVLGILKAGGAYLPVEPHFPADRIATTLSRSGCRFVMTEPGSCASVDRALQSLPDVRRLDVGTAYAEGHPTSDPRVAVGTDQLAYIYFTSGSTGEPKGAMCEHAGMLNHLFAKIEDLGVTQGSVVAQTAPQCFDISLWQLISALVVGGQTLIVEQETILDVQRFVDTIEQGHVNVLQLVPSYLEVVVTYLEQHVRELPHLRCVSTTGEALKKELTQRWFAIKPGVRLVNAYGLTETSDDTNHEVLHRAPDGDRVPLGPPVINVHVYVVDEHLSPVPLGAPGMIVFSGVCVGRGYVNDPERTRQSFLSDPHREGQRLYCAGDYGRWQPDGKLDFLGRKDTQVKISGFRIEIGEIENALLGVPDVRDGAVVVGMRSDRGKHLVAFYSGSQPVDVAVLRAQLGRSLPDYMIPATYHWQDMLPLTANGKIDRKALTVLASELATVEANRDAPRTPTEQRLAAAWAAVLDVPTERIGRRDHFFDRGGTSLSAVRMAIALNREVSLKDLTRHPVLADLATLVDGRSGHGSTAVEPAPTRKDS